VSAIAAAALANTALPWNNSDKYKQGQPIHHDPREAPERYLPDGLRLCERCPLSGAQIPMNVQAANPADGR